VAGPKAGSSPVGIWTYNPYIVHKIPVDSLLNWTRVAERPTNVPPPVTCALHVPSPANGAARIEFSLARAVPTELRVLDAAGRSMATLVTGLRQPGTHAASWRTLARHLLHQPDGW